MIDKNILFSYLDKNFSDAHCELNYSKDYELLIAIMLSSQTTDKAVNKVTALLFAKYPSLEQLKNADIKDVESILSSIGMYKVKARNVIGIATKIIDEYNGVVPQDPELLTALPGVGNKTKNCFLAEMYNYPLLALDTHVQRISKRLKLVKKNDSLDVMEKKITKFIPSERLVKTNHQLIWFGRYFCKAKNPKCSECELKQYCSKTN